MKWYEEARCQIMRRSVAERGFLFTVREVFNNSATVPLEDMEQAFGMGWEAIAEGLKKTGLLEVLRGKHSVQMTVHLPGDKKREYLKRYWHSRKEQKA